jgi:hypothetical protein
MAHSQRFLPVTYLPVEWLPSEYSEKHVNAYALALRHNPQSGDRELVVSDAKLTRVLALPLARGTA